MLETLTVAARLAVVTLALTGIAYPLAVTGLAQAFFPHRAAGSPIAAGDGRIVGSEWIGQTFADPGYFHSRPSAAGYDASASAGSNLGPTSAALRARVQAESERLLAENPDARGPIPADLLTTSGSGLDPHVSPEAARWQAPRVARARGVEVSRVEALVEARTEARQLGVLGEPRVNVLRLNLDLDREWPRSAADSSPPRRVE